jgi:hypothetical protein
MAKASREEWTRIAHRFLELWNFPNCARAIDGIHIRIQCPPSTGSTYYNYKNFHCSVLLAIAKAEGKCTAAADIGDYIKSSDGILKETNSGKVTLITGGLNLPNHRTIFAESENLPFTFADDEAYRLMGNLMRPFPQKVLKNEKWTYNLLSSVNCRRYMGC